VSSRGTVVSSSTLDVIEPAVALRGDPAGQDLGVADLEDPRVAVVVVLARPGEVGEQRSGGRCGGVLGARARVLGVAVNADLALPEVFGRRTPSAAS
jgi:hypothetical protein